MAKSEHLVIAIVCAILLGSMIGLLMIFIRYRMVTAFAKENPTAVETCSE